jgi:hypothetical protein
MQGPASALIAGDRGLVIRSRVGGLRYEADVHSSSYAYLPSPVRHRVSPEGYILTPVRSRAGGLPGSTGSSVGPVNSARI